MCNSFTNYVVRRLMVLMVVLMVLLVSQVSWWPLLRDKLSQPVAVAELDDQTEEKTGHCEAHGGLWRSERPDSESGAIFILSPPLPSSLLVKHNVSLGKFYISQVQFISISLFKRNYSHWTNIWEHFILSRLTVTCLSKNHQWTIDRILEYYMYMGI